MAALGLSLLLIAVGAILAYAVDATAVGLDIDAVGFILMGVDALGVLMSVLFLMSFSPFGNHETRTTTHIDAWAPRRDLSTAPR